MKVFPLVLLVLALAPGCSWACTPVPVDESTAREARAVFVGYAISLRWPRDTPHLLVSVTITETLKGDPVGSLEAISPCGLPIRKGDRVVVVNSGEHLLIYPAELYEQVVRAGVRDGR